MKKLTISYILLASMIFSLSGQQDQSGPKNSISIMFWNVENLFDTADDPETADEEFTPAGSRQWDQAKYSKKIADIAETISSIGERELPGIIGLCETENRKVLDDLASAQKLKRGGYSIVHYDSKDERGIDVSLLYREEELTLIDSRVVPVIFSADIKDMTRDILYARFKADDGFEYHIFVNHWPSRSPSAEESEAKRISAAIALRKEVDMILNKDNYARIIIMGDFNDEPTNRSIFQILNATPKRKNVHYRDMYNLMFEVHNTTLQGTLTYRDQWQMFDQIIVSPSVINADKGYRVSFEAGRIFSSEKLIIKGSAEGKNTINRTYEGVTYTGGISDHLPVYTVLRKEKN